MPAKKQQEEFVVSGEEVVKKVRELLKEGNIRSIVIKNEKDTVLFKVPLTVGLFGLALAPVWAALGAAAALVTNCKIVVERREDKKTKSE